MQQIIECVPNFSNGRDPEVYGSIADAVRGVTGASVLDISADPDHNRTVITFVGKTEAVEEAAFRAIAKAAELINLEEHEGEHPRIGATDVFPFIPVKGASVDDCVTLAHRVAKRVGEELGIAVYLYGNAATRPERKKLSSIRKGEYERWKEEVEHIPERQPDYGPAEPKPWGATVIGVRPFLIAYNIYLNSSDVDIAEKIARNIRFIGGGLRFVQAKGFLVEGQAQVSMNLTDFERTPVYRVQELVRREAERYGLSITKAELVGLIPQKALMDSAKWYLQLDDVDDDQVLEFRLQQEQAADFTPALFLEATAQSTPTPGGGAVAAAAGAMAAALTEMVAGLTVGRKKYADVEDVAQEVLERATDLRQQLTTAISEDSAAFDSLMDAYRDRESDATEKAQWIEQATTRAGEVPLQVARLGRDVARLSQKIAQCGNVNAVTDAAAGAIMAGAAVQTAALNVKINRTGLKDRDLAETWKREIEALLVETSELVESVSGTAAERGGF